MLKNKKGSFTFVELVMVIAIIGILMLGMTIYLGKSGEKAKAIEAEGCANALGGALGNYVFYTLTSRELRFPNNDIVSPKYYYIELTGGNQTDEKRCIPENIGSGHLCKQIDLLYSESYESPELYKAIYENLTVSNTCRHGKPRLGFYRSGGTQGDIKYIRMNKGFIPREINAERVFFLQQSGDVTDINNQLLLGDIIVVLCSDDKCACDNAGCARKQIGKRHVDARSQTIAFKKCRFYYPGPGSTNYDGTGANICKTREDCMIYDTNDPTLCKEY